MRQSKKFKRIQKEFKEVRLGVTEHAKDDPVALKFADLINNLSEKLRSYALYQLKKDPAGMMIKMYILSKANGDTNGFLDSLMLQWNVSEEDFQRHSQELMDEGLLKNKK